MPLGAVACRQRADDSQRRRNLGHVSSAHGEPINGSVRKRWHVLIGHDIGSQHQTRCGFTRHFTRVERGDTRPHSLLRRRERNHPHDGICEAVAWLC